MQAALPHTDDFLASHNLQALDELGRLLAGLDRHKRPRSAGRLVTVEQKTDA